MENKNENLPRIFYEGGAWLIWTAEEVEKIWETAKVLGTASMTAPFFPKQSKILSLPYELSEIEVKWCFDRKLCVLVEPKFKIELNNIDQNVIPDKYEKPINIDNRSEYDIINVDPPNVDIFLYKTFCQLKEKDYWIFEGGNYGCDFVIYKMEPWKCHASTLVWCQRGPLDTRELIQHVRIAESTKKNAVAAVQVGDEIKYINFTRYKTQNDPDDVVVIDEDSESD